MTAEYGVRGLFGRGLFFLTSSIRMDGGGGAGGIIFEISFWLQFY